MKIRWVLVGVIICGIFSTDISPVYAGTDQGVLLEDMAAVQAQTLYDDEADSRRLAFIPLFLFGTVLFAAGGFGRKVLAKKKKNLR